MTLLEWGRENRRCVFDYNELARLLGLSRCKRKLEGLVRSLIAYGVLEHAGRDVYILLPLAREGQLPVLDQAARVAGGYRIIIESLETAASRWGIISQKYARMATYITSGRSRTLTCSFGIVVLIHTACPTGKLIEESIDRGPELTRLSNEKMTIHMLRRTGRATELLREWELEQEE